MWSYSRCPSKDSSPYPTESRPDTHDSHAVAVSKVGELVSDSKDEGAMWLCGSEWNVRGVIASTGTLRDGRYNACPVHGDTYGLCCYRCIENNPAHAAMVAYPSNYSRPNDTRNAFGHDDPLVQPHTIYAALGPTAEDRQRAYEALFAETLSVEDTAAIREHLQRQRASGSEGFRASIEATLKRRVGRDRPGRPSRAPSSRAIA